MNHTKGIMWGSLFRVGGAIGLAFIILGLVLFSLPAKVDIAYADGGLDVTKTATPTEVSPGELLTYTLTVTNNTSDTLRNVVVTDTLPAHTLCALVKSRSGWDDNAAACESGTDDFVRWAITDTQGLLNTAGNNTVRFTFVVTVTGPISDQSRIENTDYIVTGVDDDTPTYYTDYGPPYTETLVAAPSWTITKTATPDPVRAGDILTYTIWITNSGHLTTSGTYTIIEMLPDHTSYVDADPAYTSLNAPTVTWVYSASSLGPDEGKMFTVTVQVDDPITDGTPIVNEMYGVMGGSVLTPAYGSPYTVTAGDAILELVKTGWPATVEPGSLLTYTLYYSNVGHLPASNVRVVDVLPDDTTVYDGSPGGYAPSGSPPRWRWNLGALAADGSGSLTLTLQLSAPLDIGTILTNNARINADDASLYYAPPVTHTVGGDPVLTVTKEALGPPLPGELFTYTIRYTNTGPVNAYDVTLWDIFPDHTAYDSATPGGSSTPDGRAWTVASLSGEGGSGVITLTLAVDTALDTGTILTNVVAITSAEVLTPTYFILTNEMTATPEITLSKQVNTDTLDLNQSDRLTYTIYYTNTSPVNAIGVRIRDTLPASVSLVYSDSSRTLAAFSEVTSGTYQWVTGGRLWPNQSGVLTIGVQITTPQEIGTVLTNTAQLRSRDSDWVAVEPVTTTLTGNAILTVTKEGLPAGLEPGQSLTYTIHYTNSANLDADNVTITDIFPDHLSYNGLVSANPSPDGNGTLPGNTGHFWQFDTVPGGSSGAIVFSMTLASPLTTGLTLTNVVMMTSTDALTMPVYTATNQVTGTPDLTITKTVSDFIDLNADQSLVYTIRYTNTSPNVNATDVVITEVFPLSTTYNSYTADPSLSGSLVPGVGGRWTIASLPGGGSGVITLTLDITTPQNAGTVLTNAVIMTATEIVSPAVATTTTTITGTPGLTVTKEVAGLIDLAQTQTLTYTIHYTNEGNLNATVTRLIDTFPVSTTFAGADPSGDLPPWGTNIRRWVIGDLAGGDSGTIVLTLTVAAPQPAGTLLENRISIRSNEVTWTPFWATTEITGSALLSVTKTASPTVTPGSYLTYTIRYTNSGGVTGQNYLITDTFPVSASYAGSVGQPTPVMSSSISGGYMWAVPSLSDTNHAGWLTVTLYVEPPQEAGTVLTNTVVVTAENALKPVTDTFTSTVVGTPELVIDKTGPLTVDLNLTDLVTYTIRYTNTNPNINASGLVITEIYPLSTTYYSHASDPVLAASGFPGGGVLTGAGVPGGSSGVVTLTLQINTPQDVGTILTNTAIITANEVLTQDVATATTVITGTPQFSISKQVNASTIDLNVTDLLTYTIYYTNTGSLNADDLFILDLLPVSATVVATDPPANFVSDDRARWNLSSLAGGASGALTMTVRISTPQTIGTVLENRALIRTVADPATRVATPLIPTTIVGNAALTVTKTGDPAAVEPGNNLVYTIRYTNTANLDAANVFVTDTFPLSATYVGSTANPPATTGGPTADGYSWQFDTVPGNSSGLITLTLYVEPPQTVGELLTNTVRLTSTDALSEAVYTATNVISGTPTLVIHKDGQPAIVEAGSTLTYTIRYTNTGGVNAAFARITDTFPLSVTYLSSGGDPAPLDDAAISGGYVWTVPTVLGGNGGGTITVTVHVSAPRVAGEVLTNVVEITGSGVLTPDIYTATNIITSTPVLSIAKLPGTPEPVKSGGLLTYTIYYSNTGNADTTESVLIRDVFENLSPGMFQFVSQAADPAISIYGEIAPGYRWRIDDPIPAGGGGTITLTLRVTSPITAGTVLRNRSLINYVGQAVAARSDVVFNTVAPITADLEITKTTALTEVAAGQNITYTLTVTNNGPDSATVVVTDTYPAANASLVDCGGCTASGSGVITWNDVALDVGGSQSFTVVLGVAWYAGTLTNTTGVTLSAGYGGTAIEPVPGDNTAWITTPVYIPPLEADLEITKTTAVTELLAGEQVAYTLVFTNNGPDAASVTITDTFPAAAVANIVDCDGCAVSSTDTITWNLAIIGAGSSDSRTIILETAAYSGTLTNTAGITFSAATSNTIDPDPGNNSDFALVSVRYAEGDLAIAKTTALTEVVSGRLITYTVTITNNGPDTVDAVVTDTFTAAAVASVVSCDGCAVGTDTLTWTVSGFVPSSASYQVVLQASGSYSGPLTNTVGITFATGLLAVDPAAGNNDDSVTTPVRYPEGDLAIVKTTALTEVVAGQHITYTVTITNNGPDTVDAVVTDTFTVAAVASVVSCDGCAIGTDTLTWTMSGFVPSSASYQVVLQASGSYSGPLTNTVGITFATGLLAVDPAAGNNDDSVTTPVRYPEGDLAIVKTTALTEVVAGQHITYTVTITNNGPDTVDAVVTDTFTAAAVASVVSCDGCAIGTDTLTWTMSGFVPSSASYQVVLQASGSYSGPLTNTVGITFATGLLAVDPAAGNNDDSVTTPVRYPEGDLAIVKTTALTEVVSGRLITYTVTITNNGPDTVDAVVTDTFTAAAVASVVSCDGCAIGTDTLTWTMSGFVPSSASYQVVLRTDTLYSGTLTNTVGITFSGIGIDAAGGNNDDLITTPVRFPSVSEADLVIAKTTVLTEVAAGENITYTLTITNNGPDTVDVLITDTYHTSAITSIVDCDFCLASSTGAITWQRITFGAGATATYTVVLETNPLYTGTLTNTVGITFSDSYSQAVELVPGDNSHFITTPVRIPPLQADVEIVKTTALTEVISGETITYTLTVTNNGPDTVPVIITDTFPAAAVAAVEACDGCAMSATGAITWQVSSFTGTTSYQVVLRTAGTYTGVLTNTAAITFYGLDSAPDNNSDFTTTPVQQPLIPEAELNIRKRTDQTSVTAGETVTYTIIITNEGPNMVDAVVVDTYPTTGVISVESCDGCAISATGAITWQQNNFAAGDAFSYTVVLRTDPAYSGILANTANITFSVAFSQATDPTAENNIAVSPVIVTAGGSDLAMDKQTDQTAVSPGERITYTLTITNNGPNTVDIVITDTFPAAAVAAVESCDGCVAGADTLTWTVSSFTGTTSYQVVLRTATEYSGLLVNTAGVSATAATADPYPANNTDTAEVTVTTIIPSLALTVTKTAMPAPGSAVQPGQTIIYTIRVTNTGSLTLNNVNISDTLPGGLAYVGSSTTGDGGVILAGGVVMVSTGQLETGQALVATIELSVTETVSGTILSNRAAAWSDEIAGPVVGEAITHMVVVTPADNNVYLPIILVPPVAPFIDLVVEDVTLSNPNPNTGDPVEINVTVGNLGNAPVSTPFWVDLYIAKDPAFTPQLNEPWYFVDGNDQLPLQDRTVPYGVAWKLYSMPASGSQTITNLDPNDPMDDTQNYSNFIPNDIGNWPKTHKGVPLNNYFRDPGTYYLYVQVDSYSDPATAYGAVSESDEGNNIYGPIVINVGGSSIPFSSVSISAAEAVEDSPAGERPSVRR